MTAPAETAVASDIRPSLTLTLLSVQHAIIHGQSALYGLLFLAVATEFGATPGEVALLVTVGSVISGLIQLGFGALTRRISRKALLASGGVLLGVGTALQALTASFVPFAAANIASRLGGAPQHPVGNALIAEQYEERRRGFAIATHVAGGNVGTVAIGIVAGWAIVTLGWRWSVVLLGLPAIAVGAAIWLLVRESGEDRRSAEAAGSVRGAYGRVVGDPNMRWLFLSSVLGGGARGLGTLNIYVPLYLGLTLGLDPSTIAAMYAVLLAFSVPGPVVSGWLSDRVGRKPVIIGVYAAGALSLVFFVLAGSDALLLWAAVVALGAFSFVESPQLQALLADIAPAELRDAAYSTYFALAFGIGSLWGAVYTYVLSVTGSQQGLPIVFGIMAAASGVAALSVLPIRASAR